MSILKNVGVVLMVAGVIGLIYGSFVYSSNVHSSDIGSVHLQVDENKTINIPVWVSIGAIALGAGLLLTSKRRQ